MKAQVSQRRLAGSQGSSLLEFAICGFLSVIMLFSVIEMGRMVLVYTTVANAARAGVRYAIVHGGTSCGAGACRTGTGYDGVSGPADNPVQVVQVIRNFASTGLLDPSKLVLNTTGAGAGIYVHYTGGNVVGAKVNVRVVYPYDPFTRFFPLNVNLGSATEGIIVL